MMKAQLFDLGGITKVLFTIFLIGILFGTLSAITGVTLADMLGYAVDMLGSAFGSFAASITSFFGFGGVTP